jgi:hypothetical protein
MLLCDGVGGGVEERDGADVSWLGVGCQLGWESDRDEGGKGREKLEMASREGKGSEERTRVYVTIVGFDGDGGGG